MEREREACESPSWGHVCAFASRVSLWQHVWARSSHGATGDLFCALLSVSEGGGGLWPQTLGSGGGCDGGG